LNFLNNTNFQAYRKAAGWPHLGFCVSPVYVLEYIAVLVTGWMGPMMARMPCRKVRNGVSARLLVAVCLESGASCACEARTNVTISIIRNLAFLVAVAGSAVTTSQSALAEPASPNCNDVAAAATVDDAYKVVPARPLRSGQKPAVKPDIKTVQLQDVVAVKVTNLERLYDKTCQEKTIVLFLNGHPIKSLTPYPPANPGDKILNFVLNRTEASKLSWTTILGRPNFDTREIEVSVGFEDQFPLKPTSAKLPHLSLDIIPFGWFMFWCVIFLGMIALFFITARRSNMIRDGSPIAGDVPGVSGTYSLSKSQGAWWFFVIIAAYLLIGLVTGDFSNSINSTAIILLGIGAGTVLGSAAIDAQKSAPADLQAERGKAASLRTELNQLDQDITELKKQHDAAVPPPGGVQQLTLDLGRKQEEKAQKLSGYRKLVRNSEGFLTDILSDANGISFHRFQFSAWTVVLSIIFVNEVYENLAMPMFNTTLMGLLGLSAGTYLGLKIPEPTLPK
jgi:hypothetical protein